MPAILPTMSDNNDATQSGDTPEDSDEFYESLMNDPELDEETLQQKLRDYHKAFEEEFATNMQSKQAALDPEKAHEYLTTFFKQNLPMAAAQIAWLSQNGASESVKLSASKYVVEHALADAVKDGDPIAALLEKLQQNDAKEGANS